MKKLQEQEIITNIDDKITEIIEILRDERFANSQKRHIFAVMIATLAGSKDPRARKCIRELGNYLTRLGQELLSAPVEDHELGNNFKMVNENKLKIYKSVFKDKG